VARGLEGDFAALEPLDGQQGAEAGPAQLGVALRRGRVGVAPDQPRHALETSAPLHAEDQSHVFPLLQHINAILTTSI